MDTDLSGVLIAVLIDADNSSAKYAEPILDELAKYGTPTIKRAYGDFSSSHLQGWTRELNRRGIKPVHTIAYTTGKNSTDSALIIDAMDLLYAGNVEAFAIVSSDSDYTSLALRLREAGKTVYGLGQKKTPVSLQNACDRFILLEVLGSDADGGADAQPDTGTGEPAAQLNLQRVLTPAFNATADDDGWATLGAIGNHLARSHPTWDPREFGHGKLSSLVDEQPYLQTRSAGNHLEVSLKRKAATRKSPAKKAATKASQAAKAATKA